VTSVSDETHSVDDASIPVEITTDVISEAYFLKAIDINQSIINRMARNSFLIKGWTITLVVAALLLKGTVEQGFLAIFPLLTFWLLDTYFLKQERLFRKLYSHNVENTSNTVKQLFSMNTDDFDESYFGVMCSRTLLWFYGTIFGLILGYGILLHYSWPVIYDYIVRICESIITWM